MRKILGTLLLGTFCLTMACATDPYNFETQITPPPRPVESLRKPTPKAGSMYVANRADFYTDIKAHQVGDIITVEITETSKAKKKNDTKAERTSEFKAGVPFLMGYESSLIPNYSDMINNDRGAYMFGADFKSKTDAKAELTKEDTMSAAIGCTVMEVLPNGNLIIKGQREIQVNGETQFILLHGTVRASDVSSNNSVLSTQLADARIHYTGRGVLTDKQKPGWLTRLMDSIWPF